MTSNHVYPKYQLEAFNCPLCNAYAHQYWYELKYSGAIGNVVHQLEISVCNKCKGYSIWFCNQMIYPVTISIAEPNPDMGEDAQKLYNEARAVYPHSKRAAAALLRLSLEFLCKELGATEGNLNKAIDELVTKGLNPAVKKPLDVVRVIGNNAIHPGQIDVKEDIDIIKLFDLINYITRVEITDKKQLDELVSMFPEKDQKAIASR